MILILVGTVALIVADMVGIGVVALFLISTPRQDHLLRECNADTRVTVPSTPFVAQTTPTPMSIPSDTIRMLRALWPPPPATKEWEL